MLQKLVIRNYAIIDNLSLAPDPGLNIVTGETGAGKSIILGALSLILGERADTSVLIHKEEKCFVEAHFEVEANETFRAALRRYELDDEPQCIIRREITASGKSRAFVNDTPVNLATLNKLTSLLVDLHQQFDHLALESDRFQLDVLDAIAKQAGLLESYQQQYTAYRRIGSQLAALQEKQASWQKEADYKQYLLDELNTAGFKEHEVEEADTQLKTLQHAERIRTVLQSSRYLLDEGEQPLINELKKIGQQMQSITDVLPDASPLLERLLSAHAELKDICGELEDLEGRTNLDAELMQTLQDRLDLGYKLFKKHGVLNTAGLLELQQRLSDELQETLNLSANIESLQAEQSKTLKEVAAAAQKLSAGRKKVAPEISKRVTELLALVGMPNAKFNVAVSPLPEPGPYGADEVAFQLDANRSGRFQPLHKAASGGEMSRIMLSIKSLTAEAVSLPTLIFDEVDTGISGEAARQVGYLLRELAQYHQVICITHQPQVAARGSRHFYVYKDAASASSAQAPQRITTKVRQLAQDERVLAIARMIGGEQPSEAALQNARELVVSH